MFKLAQTVERTILLDVAPEEVWEALTDETALGEWLAPEVELEPREGGELLCRYEDGEERRGEVELVEEAKRLAFRWWREGQAPSRVEFALAPVVDGTLVTVVETFDRWAGDTRIGREIGPSTSMSVATGWGARLGGLRAIVGRLVLA